MPGKTPNGNASCRTNGAATPKTKLKSCTKGNPCPVCNGHKRCSVGADGLLCCRERQGEQPGFVCLGPAKRDPVFTLYRRQDDPVLAQRAEAWEAVRGPQVNGKLAWAELASEFQAALTPDRRDELAALLGLPPNVLDTLGVGWRGRSDAWTFPERDGDGRIVGIGQRRRDGSKFQITGGRRGLLVPKGWLDRDGPLLLPEGASNTLALTALDLCAVGRPNNLSGAENLSRLLATFAAGREIIVVGDFDPKPTGRWPGLEGCQRVASQLAERLKRPVWWVLPPEGNKDVRAWVNHRELPLGCSDSWHEAGEELLANLKERRKESENESSNPSPRQESNPAAARFRAIPPYEPFPLNALPGGPRDFVRQAAAALGCDPALVALPVLAALAAAIGNTRAIRLKRGWTEPAILWTALVSDSGTLKSPAHCLAVNHLFRAQEQLLVQHKSACAAHEAELESWKKSKADGFNPGAKPERPVLGRCIVSDTTIEKLGEILEENPRGLLVARDELSGWIGSFTKYKGRASGSDVPNWLELHRAGTVMIDRKSGERRTLFIKRAAASVTGGIQPGVLSKSLTGDLLDSGLAARLLLSWPPRQRKSWSEVEVDPATEKIYHDLLDNLLALNFDQHEGHPVPRVLRLSDEAKQVWVDFYNCWAKEQSAVEGELAAAFSKLEAYAARFALLHHVVSCASVRADDDIPIDAKAIEDGIALARWFGNEARRIYSTLSESAEERERRQLLEFIGGRGGSITVRQLQRSNCRKYPDADTAEQALNDLAKANLGEWRVGSISQNGGHRIRSLVLRMTHDTSDTRPDEDEEDGDEPSDTRDDTRSDTPRNHGENGRVSDLSCVITRSDEGVAAAECDRGKTECRSECRQREPGEEG
ncbi:MAG: DUF3987 domain-containing protein [Gemmataceae bacterium]